MGVPFSFLSLYPCLPCLSSLSKNLLRRLSRSDAVNHSALYHGSRKVGLDLAHIR